MSILLPSLLFKLPVFVLLSNKGHPDALEAAGRQKIRPVRAVISTRSDAGNDTIGRNHPGATSFLRRSNPPIIFILTFLLFEFEQVAADTLPHMGARRGRRIQYFLLQNPSPPHLKPCRMTRRLTKFFGGILPPCS